MLTATTINLLLQGSVETLYMVLLAGCITLSIGLPLGMVLLVTERESIYENTIINRLLGLIVNVGRSIPFVILMIALIPMTRLIVGTSIGTTAAIVPLSMAAIPFFARITQNALGEVGQGLIEAGHAMGATTLQIACKILLPEAIPSLVKGFTITLIALIGYSAMAGAIGGGGLGAVAINYGYQRFNAGIMLATIVILVALVQLIQYVGEKIAQRLDHT